MLMSPGQGFARPAALTSLQRPPRARGKAPQWPDLAPLSRALVSPGGAQRNAYMNKCSPAFSPPSTT